MGKQTRSKSKKIFFNTNREIKSPMVRLVGDNVDQGVVTLSEALSTARKMDLDLIEFSPNANPPVCKIEDYTKFLYNNKKRQRDNEKKNKASKVELKEMRFGPNTDEHDYNFKKNHIIKFIESGDRVKAYVMFKGREIQHKDKGEILLLKLADEISDIAIPEKLPTLEGNRLVMFINPKK